MITETGVVIPKLSAFVDGVPIEPAVWNQVKNLSDLPFVSKLALMGAKSFIVRGLGNGDSLESCSHGAGRVMSRSEAKRRISVEDHIEATRGVECRKDAEMVDESPAAYKDIDRVMDAQKDLVEVVAQLRQVLCVKG